jgi:hypothetical protein
MSNQPPYENDLPVVPPTQYSQSSEYAPGYSYAQPQASYPPMVPYGQPQPVYPPMTPYGQPPVVYQPMVPYGQPMMYAYAPQYVIMPPEPGRGQALAGMVLGIIGIFVSFSPFLGLPVAITGLIFSLLGRRSFTRRGMALAGIILSSISLVLTLSFIAFLVYVIAYPRY